MAARNTRDPIRVEAEASIDMSWGGKEGFKVKGQAKGTIADKNSHASVTISQDSNGEGHANASTGYGKNK